MVGARSRVGRVEEVWIGERRVTRQGNLEKGWGAWRRIGWEGKVDARVIISRGERKRMAKASESGIGRR